MSINSTDQRVSVLIFQLFNPVIIELHKQSNMISAVEFHLFHCHELLVSGHLSSLDLSSDVMEICCLEFIGNSLFVFLPVKDTSEELNLGDCLE